VNLLRKLALSVCCMIGLPLLAVPVADFTPSVKQGCVPLTVNFTDKSTGATAYLWDFGNGNKSTLKNPSAIFYKSGNFTITLTVTDAGGKTNTKTFSPIRVFASPSANFSADTVACMNQNLVFTDLSVKADTAIVKWTWDFGDGSLSNNLVTGHKYTYSGKFTIGLTIVDGYGCKSLKTKANYVRIKPSPDAKFTLDKTYSCSLPAVFSATNTSTGANSYKWLCSDGSSGTAKDFKTNISSFGKYKITLVAIGSGCNDTFERSPLNVEKLVAKFNLPPNGLCQGDSLVFTNNSNTVSGLTYFWDFGDGNTSTEKSPKNGYNTPGTYQVKLRVSSGGCKDSVIQQIKINPAPVADISVLDSIGCNPPYKAVFKISGNDYSSSLWSFGDKTASQSFQKGSPIEHTYMKKGSYAVKAKIINSYGCAVDLELANKIHVGVQTVRIIPDEVNACLPKTVNYKPEEKLFQQVKSYEWIFTDSSAKYTTKTVNKTFYKPGNFLAILKIETVNVCIITDSAKISVGNRYYPTFKITQRDICQKDTIHYINTTNDSIKKKVKFSLKVVYSNTDIIKGDTNAVYRDTILKAQRGGLHAIKITARHFGCLTESVLSDTVNVHGPFISLIIKPLDCKYTKVSLKPTYSWANRVQLVKDDSIILDHKQKEIITSYNPSKFIFRGWNDTFGCKDSVSPVLAFPMYRPDPTYNLNQNCAPAKATFDHNGTLKDFKWIFPNGDTSIIRRPSFTFKEAGTHKVMLVGHYDSIMCPDTNLIYISIQGAIMRGSATSSGKCMPITLNLIDSTFGKDDNLHTWKIGNDVIDASGMTTRFKVVGIPQNDSVISVKHIVQSANGCTSEKEYQMPFGGPSATYLYQRFTICDTPVFYFKSFIDTSRSKLPVTYKWETSSGMVVNAQNFNAKFRTMGMNYFTLTIADKFDCKSVFYDSFEVSPNMLSPSFKADPTGRFCPPLQCQFLDFSKTFNSDIVKWEWDFGDGTTSQLKDPQKLYLLPGSYDITLKLTSKSGCTAVLKKPGYVIVNGPRGSYDFDRGNGCLPLTVGFTGKTIDSATMEWDLGDGVVRPGNNFKHVYNQRGRYIPAMILSDTLGCKYTLPPIDTIEVYDYPKAKTILSGLCFHQPIKVTQTSVSNHDNPEVKVSWFLNGNLKSPGKDSSFMPENRGEQYVRVIAENNGTCKDTFDNHIRIYAPKSDFKVSRDFVCLGNATDFLNEVTSDTTVTFYQWDFGDGKKSNDKKVRHTYDAPGKYTVSLIARDMMNCEDTMSKPEYAVVGDTISPPQVPIRRASVLNNRQVELVFSKYPTFDFTKYTVYRESAGKYYKMADVNRAEDTVFIDRQCNTLKESYCYRIASQNLCLYTSDIDFSREHCTIETKARGFLDANKVSWSPYIGFDSIARYQIWRQDFDQKGPYELLDSVSSAQLNYTDTLITCNTRKNYLVKAIQHEGFREYSFSDTASAKPYYINTTLPGYAWRATVENNEYTRVEWLNNAWSRNGIRGYLLAKYFADGQKVFDNQYYDAMDTVYEDAKVKVNDYSYVYYIRGIDNCDDTTPVSNPAQTILLKAYFDEATQKPAVTWNHYREWDQKTAYYEIEQKQEDGTFLFVGKVSATENRFVDMNAKSTCTPNYIYRVRAVSYIHTPTGNFAVSLSNEAQAYPSSTLFVPNAFSPDMNGINEGFGPKGQYISKYKLQIYNRWGEKLFETTDCMAPWNGTFMNERCQEGVYLYHIEALGADHKTYNLQATFTLLR
jgi:gliding motility-associated-like protein